MKIFKLLLALLLSFTAFVPTFADEYTYEIKDINSGFSIGFNSYEEAKIYYADNLQDYDNLLLLSGSRILDMEYGIVEFVGVDGLCQYYSTIRKQNDYIHSSYGIDAAYLYSEGDRVRFKIAGDIGYINRDLVVLHPYETLDVKTSLYSTIDNYLYHNIKTQLDTEFCSTSLQLDKKPSFMKNNTDYYSYDGHYFYTDFYLMIDDYRNEVNINAINDIAYYNYFQYLPHRSISNYDNLTLQDYFYETLGIDGRLVHYEDLNFDAAADEVNRSQFYGNIDEFFNCQYIYGTNALMLISSGIVDSSYGKSLDSYIKNNIYSNAAYETEEEKEYGRYNSVSNSIYSHAKYYISRLYSNYQKESYCGTHFGNKLSGINIEYSLDQYYGEKATSEYFKIDNALGSLDYNSCAIGIVEQADKLVLYRDNELENKLSELNNVHDLSFVILEENEDTYLIQIDPSHSSEYVYSFDDSVAYISKDVITNIVNEDRIHNYEFNKINYDFNGGSYHGYETLSYKTINNNIEPTVVPYKEGYEFTDYSDEIDENGHHTYVANYIRIKSINAENLFDYQKDLLPYPNLAKAKLIVKYEDGSTYKIPVTSDMISAYSLYVDTPQVITITYNGVCTNKIVQLDTSYYETCANIDEAIANNDCTYIRDNMENVNYPLTVSQVRNIDYVLKQNNDRNYVIVDKTGKYNISISGLDLSLDDRKNFSLIEDTYYVNVDSAKVYNQEKIVKTAKGYGFDVETSLNISFKFNYQNIYLRGPAIVQIDLANKKNNRIYSVYHVNSNGDIVKCRTTQSNNFVQFVINEGGDYVVLSMPSINSYNIDDTVENLSYENMGFDNNRINLEFMIGLSLILIALAGIIIYYLMEDIKEKQWKDYKKLLQKVDTVQEEKQKS